jgi:hypothetical protein
MDALVVDTNVPVVANQRISPQASLACVEACVLRLEQLQKSGRLVLDDGRRILEEYCNYLNESGQPGVGDAFLLWALRNQGTDRCERVTLTPLEGDDNFLEFPVDRALKNFDRSDRKFVAVALAHPERPPILQAVDSKWWGFKDALNRNGVRVEFLCPDDLQRLQVRKAKRQRIIKRRKR